MEFSTVTACGPDAWMSMSVIPRQGRRIEVPAVRRWDRLSLVAICTASVNFFMAANVVVGSGIATARLPPRQTKRFRPTVGYRFHGFYRIVTGFPDGLNLKTRSMPSRSAASGVSVIPIVRSPCPLECPRTGHRPAPGLPILPLSNRRFAACCTLAVPFRCWVRPIP